MGERKKAVRLNVRVERELGDRLERLADRRAVTVGALVRFALYRFADQEEVLGRAGDEWMKFLGQWANEKKP